VPGLRRYEALLPRAGHRVELSAPEGSGQAVLGWSVERRRPGIVYENHGTIGATVALLKKLTPAAVFFELGERQPALLVVAFGTNEGFDDALDLGRYAALFDTAVGELRRAAPGAAVLIVGPPDGNRRAKDCTAQSQPANCGAADACAWSEPRNLAAVRDIQRRVARREGWAFWDWSAAMGGRCSIDRWFGRDKPLAMPDHVHLNGDGYAAAADMLFFDLMRGYDEWKRGRYRATRH
jgi:lysophospholipase L1-like esterase